MPIALYFLEFLRVNFVLGILLGIGILLSMKLGIGIVLSIRLGNSALYSAIGISLGIKLGNWNLYQVTSANFSHYQTRLNRNSMQTHNKQHAPQ